MGRYSSNPSHGHLITRVGPDDFTISWTCDYYVHGCYPRQRLSRTTRVLTDKIGAERFAKKWGVKIPPLKCRHHPKYQAKRPPKAKCARCQAMWWESSSRPPGCGAS